MKQTTVTSWLTHFLNTLVTLVLLLFLILWAMDVVGLPDVEKAVEQFRSAVPAARVLTVVAAGVLLVLNVYHVVSRIRTTRYETHLRSETEDGEVSVAVEAVENTLKRAVEGLEEIRDARVEVLKQTNQKEDTIPVRATVTTSERTKFKNVVEHVRRALRDRWNEIMEPDDNPYFEIILRDVVDERSESTRAGSGDEGSSGENPYRSSSFSGPRYPVDEEEDEDDESSSS